MQLKRFVGSTLLAAGLLAGCGGIEAGGEEPSHLESREDALPFCHNMEYERLYYAEPEKLTVVGGWTCICYVSNPGRWGATTPYFTTFNEVFCGDRPGAGSTEAP
jgi:hypothetical protein